MFKHFSERAIGILKIAQYESEQFGRQKIGSEHLLLGMITDIEGSAGQLLHAVDVTKAGVCGAIVDLNETSNYEGHLMFTPNAKRALDAALRQAIEVKSQVGDVIDVRSEHVLLGVLLQENCSAQRVLQRLQVDMDMLMGLVLWSTSGVDAKMAMLVRSGQVGEATKMIRRHIRVAEAVAKRARLMQDQLISLAAGVM